MVPNDAMDILQQMIRLLLMGPNDGMEILL